MRGSCKYQDVREPTDIRLHNHITEEVGPSAKQEQGLASLTAFIHLLGRVGAQGGISLQVRAMSCSRARRLILPSSLPAPPCSTQPHLQIDHEVSPCSFSRSLIMADSSKCLTNCSRSRSLQAGS